jgi:hypothetical protein
VGERNLSIVDDKCHNWEHNGCSFYLTESAGNAEALLSDLKPAEKNPTPATETGCSADMSISS